MHFLWAKRENKITDEGQSRSSSTTVGTLPVVVVVWRGGGGGGANRCPSRKKFCSLSFNEKICSIQTHTGLM